MHQRDFFYMNKWFHDKMCNITCHFSRFTLLQIQLIFRNIMCPFIINITEKEFGGKKTIIIYH